MARARLLLAAGLAIALLVALGVLALRRAAPPAVSPLPATSPAAVARSSPESKVYVTGAVQRPGVYTVQAGDRVEDAIRLAGGPADDADLDRLNLAIRLRDELQVHVPRLSAPGTPVAEPAPPQPAAAAPASAGSGQATTGAARAAPATGAPRPSPTPGRVNVNTATAAQLERLPGIGEISARRIVEYRQQNGPYRSPEDLRQAGVSAAILRRAADYLTFD